ncbi:uncharacterized protein LOC143252044 isoform X5 [Tachypleus tridentatus]|uniref:uncharacterized protein LOC143252044 isoform X5 n=1 Tax=Tachypleus tridentatus TaxID=6853 RepID=UPI003FD2A78A
MAAGIVHITMRGHHHTSKSEENLTLPSMSKLVQEKMKINEDNKDEDYAEADFSTFF